MSKVDEFLKAIGVSSDTIEALQKEDAKPKELAESFHQDQRTVFLTKEKAAIIEEVKPEINAAALKSVQESLKTRLKREFELDIPNIKSIAFDTFLVEATEQIKSKTKGGTDEETKAKLKELTDKYSQALESVEDLTTKLDAKSKEVEKAIAEHALAAKLSELTTSAYGKITWAGTENQQKFFKDQLTAEIMRSFVVSDDGQLKNKDGTPVVRDGTTIVKTLDDFIVHRANAYDMVKKNAARGDEPGGTGGTGGAGGTLELKPKIGADGKPINPNFDKAKAAAEAALQTLEG